MTFSRSKPILGCVAATALAAFLTACGNSGSSTATAPAPVTLTQSDLSGTYVYNIGGTDPTDGDYVVVGSITADGNGKITSGVADYNLGSGIDTNVPLTGTYSVAGGIATINLTDSKGVNQVYTASLSKTGSTTIHDTGTTGVGTLYQPVTSAFAPVGSYSFTLKGDGQDDGSLSASGSFVSAATGNFASGSETYTDAATMLSYPAIGGFLEPAQASGRGQAVIGGNNFAYYVTAPTQIALVGLDDRALISGTATKQ